MKASIALLRPMALLFMMALFFGDGLGEYLVVDQIQIPAHASQVADGGSTVASSVPSSWATTSVPTLISRSVCVNSIAPHGVSNRPGDPVVMQVRAVVICEMAPASDSLVSRLT
jgi:hypothetical protein